MTKVAATVKRPDGVSPPQVDGDHRARGITPPAVTSSETMTRREQQADNNRSMAGSWDLYETHRARVTDLLVDLGRLNGAVHAGRPPTLCVLGAGNVNDLDLPALAASFGHVQLVDIDEDALRAGVSNQQVRSAPTISIWGNVDLTAAADRAWLTNGGTFDVVASTGLLSQLVMDLVNQPSSPAPGASLISEVGALRAAHAQLMIQLMAAHGRGVIVNDLVSSLTVPDLADVPAAHLPRLMEHLLHNGNFFTGSNPYAIAQQLSSPPLSATSVALHRPWIWQMTASVSRLTYAITFRRP